MTREEAIKEAYGIPVNKKQHEALQILIPELREGEDERIRKIIRLALIASEDELSDFYKVHKIHRKECTDWLEKQKDASYAIEAVDRIDKYIGEHLANAHDMKGSNPDKKYYQGWDDALGKMAGILQDVYSNEKQKGQKAYNKLYEDIAKSEWFKKAYEGKSLGGDDEQGMEECEYDKETITQKAYREGQNAGRQEVFDNPGTYGLEKIDNVFGFRIGDKVRLADGDGRPHIIKYFEKIEGLHGPDFYHVVFEDNTASDHIIPGDEYPNGYFTCMEKIDEQKEQKPRKFKLGDNVHWPDDDTNVITITGFRDDAYLTDSAYGPILFCDEDNWERIEQKPADWSKLQEEFRNINEAFEDGKKEVIEHPEKYGLQKPPEWTKEDDALLKEIVSFFKDGTVKLQHDLDLYAGFLQNKFKSLRSQSRKELSIEKAIQWLDDTFYFLDNSSGRGRDCEITTHDFDSLEEMYDSFRKAVIVDSEPSWKPSEEQMEAFSQIVQQFKPDKELESLYEDLQKRYGTS